MKKSGQVTIFIIIAILIIACVVLFFVFKDSLIGQSEVPVEVAPVVNFVQECIDKTFEESLYQVSRQGGYSGYSYLSREVTKSDISYYFYERNNYFPSKNLVENQIGEYFERKFFLCINDFNKFSNYEIGEGVLETSVSIEDEECILNVRYPLSIRKDKDSVAIKKFESEIPVRFGIVYDSVSSFIKGHETQETICLSCLEMAVNNNIYIDMQNSYDNTVVFIFRDNSSELNGEPLEWVFANKY